MNFLEKIRQLRPVFFKMRKDEFPQYKFSDSLQCGLIAQEVEKIFPELVCKWKDDYKTIHYPWLPMYLLKAIQEQQKEIDSLKQKLEKI